MRCISRKCTSPKRNCKVCCNSSHVVVSYFHACTHLSQHTALHSEQIALLDFLVLAAGRQYVGFGASTFSFFLREYRLLQGFPRDTTTLVNASVITTDPLFYSAALVMPYP